MKFKKLFLLIFFITLLNSCGFKIMNSSNINNFYIQELEINGDNRLAYELENNLMILSNQDSDLKYKMSINLKTKKNGKIKNTAGRFTRFTLAINANLEIKSNKTERIFKKSFIITSDYDVGNTNTDTLANEKNALKNNINSLTDEIINHIRLISR